MVFSILLLAGTLEISVEPNGANVAFVQVGPEGNVDGNNQFSQVGNLFGVTGMSMIDAPFPFEDQVVDLSTVKPVPFDIVGAQLSLDGDQLTLSTTVNIDFDFEVIGGTATMNLNGPLVLVGTVKGGGFVLGDVNCDGEVNLLDVSPFVDLIINAGFSDKADMNADGEINLLDVQPFVDLLANG